MVTSEKNFASNPYLTGQNQLQITYKPAYPDISNSQWGIDTVNITFPVGLGDYDPRNGWRASTQADGTLTRLSQKIQYRNQDVFVSINVIKGWCFISFNAAKFVHSDHISLLDPDFLISEIKTMLIFLFPFVSSSRIWNKHRSPISFYPNWHEELNLKRLDITINLEGVSKQNFHDLKRGKIPRSNKRAIFESPIGVETISIFTHGEGHRKIYDKTNQLRKIQKRSISKQVHRFEVQLQNSRLTPVKKLTRINRTLVWELLKQHWEEAGFRLHSATDQLKDAIQLLYPTIGNRINGYLNNKEDGKLPTITPPTKRKYEKIIQETEKLIDPKLSGKNFLELENLIKKHEAIPVNSDENSE